MRRSSSSPTQTCWRAFHLEARAEGTAAVRAFVVCADTQAELVARKLSRLTAERDVTLEYDAGS